VADVRGVPSLVTFSDLGQPDWYVSSSTPVSAVVRRTQTVQRTILLLVAGVFALYALTATAFLRRLVSPVQQLCDLMNDAESGRFREYDGSIPNDEIGLLVSSFNRMSSRLENLINRQYASQLKLRETELTALQNQINPHFLYNTLDVLYWVSRLEHADRSSELVKALSELFRYTLDERDRKTTVEREVNHLSNYLVIQQARHEGAVTFQVDVEPQTLDMATMKLILQPLVENAIVHGIDRNGGTGIVGVRIFIAGETLVYSIYDDGPGMSEDAIVEAFSERPSTSGGIGLRNVHDRIRLLYGDEFGVTVEAGVPRGTVVLVRQPALSGGGVRGTAPGS
jgi:two-component system sensor histidine kinase YesM